MPATITSIGIDGGAVLPAPSPPPLLLCGLGFQQIVQRIARMRVLRVARREGAREAVTVFKYVEDVPLSLIHIAVSSSGSNDLGQEVLDVPQTPSIEITFEDMHVYQNALGATCATYLARLENTSDTAVAITDTSIDIEKPDGTRLTSTDFFSVYPRVVQVGERCV